MQIFQRLKETISIIGDLERQKDRETERQTKTQKLTPLLSN